MRYWTLTGETQPLRESEMVQDVALQAAPAELTAHRRSLRPLTGIRFFAAFYVVIFHTRVGQLLYDRGHHAAGNFFFSGYLAVPLFFLLSGFILAYTYEGQIEEPGDHRRFWEARFARIWPVYALSLLLSSVPSLAFPPLGKALAAMFMVQAWNPFDQGMAGTWNLVCWTLSVEAFFYLCFPWVQVWLEQRGTRTQLTFIGLMLAACVALNSGTWGLGHPHTAFLSWIPLPLIHLPEFLTGVGLGNYFLRRLWRATTHPGTPILPGAGAWTYGFTLLSIALLCTPKTMWTSLVVIAFAGLLYGLAAEKTLLSRLLSNKTVLLGGGISYSIYLMQMPVKAWVKMLGEHLHIASETVRMGLSTVLLVIISLILFKAVEDPARKVLRRVFAGLEERRQARQVAG